MKRKKERQKQRERQRQGLRETETERQRETEMAGRDAEQGGCQERNARTKRLAQERENRLSEKKAQTSAEAASC